MNEGGTEDKEAAIIRRVYQGTYSHAETVMHRLTILKLRLPHPEAIAQLHEEVMDE